VGQDAFQVAITETSTHTTLALHSLHAVLPVLPLVLRREPHVVQDAVEAAEMERVELMKVLGGQGAALRWVLLQRNPGFVKAARLGRRRQGEEQSRGSREWSTAWKETTIPYLLRSVVDRSSPPARPSVNARNAPHDVAARDVFVLNPVGQAGQLGALKMDRSAGANVSAKQRTATPVRES
jgi:hypothetical protein